MKNCQREQTWIIHESADCRSHRSGRDNVVPEKLQQFAVTLRIQNQSSGELFMEEMITHWQTTNLSIFVSILTSGLMRYFRCSSIIASNAAVVGANTVIGPGWSSKDARGVFCRQQKFSTLINLQLRNLRTRPSFTWMCYWDKCLCSVFEVAFRQRSVLTLLIFTHFFLQDKHQGRLILQDHKSV